MKILIACEESQRITIAMRQRGHECYSCDIIEPSGGHPEWHIQQDVIPLLNGPISFQTNDGQLHNIDKWDLIIAHPPCQFLTNTGNKYFNEEVYGEKAHQRKQNREDAINFFMKIANANCDKIAIENPVGCMSTRWRKPDQIIQPYMFGNPIRKRTCLWLKGLPKLKPTNQIEPEEQILSPNGKKIGTWYRETYNIAKKDRAKERSKTFPEVAKAIAEQWG